jgi:hypothetical protein
MLADEIDALREYHARRSAEEKYIARSGSGVAAERHLFLHHLHEMMCIDLCSTTGATTKQQ